MLASFTTQLEPPSSEYSIKKYAGVSDELLFEIVNVDVLEAPVQLPDSACEADVVMSQSTAALALPVAVGVPVNSPEVVDTSDQQIVNAIRRGDELFSVTILRIGDDAQRFAR